MEKITKEKLLNKLGGKALSDDDLEQVSGGKEAPVEGKKYADSNAPAADKPTFKAS